MVEITCEHCRGIFKKKNFLRFCSQKCAYAARAALGLQVSHKTKHSEESIAKIRAARAMQGDVWNKGIKTGLTPWNKGLTSETNEIVRAGGVKSGAAHRGKKNPPMSDETKRKLGDGRKGDKNWAKRPDVREKIRKAILQLYRDRPEILENRKRCGRNQFSGEFSSLELLVAVAMQEGGILYIHNSRVGRFWADFIIFGRVIIECDGAYWHRDAEKERRRDAYLTARGFFVFHLKEADIIADPAECVRNVLAVYHPFAELAV